MRQSDGPVGSPEHFGFIVGPRVTPFILKIEIVSIGASSQRISVVGVNFERALEQGSRLIEGFALFVQGLRDSTPDQGPAMHGQIDDVWIVGVDAFLCLSPNQLITQSVRQTRDHLILQLE